MVSFSTSPLVLRHSQLIVNKSHIIPTNHIQRQHYSYHRDSREALYHALRVKPGAPFDEIQAAYRRLCFELHPDTGPKGSNRKHNRDELIRVIKSYQKLKKLKEKDCLLNPKDYDRSSRQFQNFKHYRVYPGGPYDFSGTATVTSHAPVYGSNQWVVSWIIAAAAVCLVMQYYRFDYTRKNLVDERNRRFEEAEETYKRVRMQALSMTSRERIKKFIEDYFKN